jgi:DNA polymerase-3 subunit epsilon
VTHRQVFLDTETTGLSAADGHRIIEIGCVETIDRWLTGNNFHVRLNPGRSIDAEAKRKHGITESDLIGAPVFSDVAEQLCEYLRGAEILMHNATFDVAFLNNEFSLSGRVERMADLGIL